MDYLEEILKNKNIFIPKDFNKYKIYLVEVKDRQFDMLENLAVVYILNGSVEISEIDSDIHLDKNDIYILNKNIPHIIEGSDSKNIALIIEIKDNYLRDYLNKDDYYFSSELNTLEKKMIVGILGKLFLDSLDKDLSSEEKDVIIEKLLSMINLTSRENKEVKDNDNVKYIVYEIAEYILKNYLTISQNNITLEDIANDYNVSYHYLSRSFKRYLGENYTSFLLRIRLENALDLILNTDDKIIHISEASGFNSVKAFNVAFKKAFNLSPTEFKNKFKESDSLFYRQDLYLNESTQKFIDNIKYLEHFNILNDDDLYYKIDRQKFAGDVLKKIDFIVDINALFDINKNLHLLEDVIEDLEIKKLIINIIIDGNNIYLLDRYNNKRLLSSMELNKIINVVYENKVDLIVLLNAKDKTLNTEELIGITHLTNMVTATLGLNGLSNFIFGIKIDNIMDKIEKNSDRLYKLIKKFQDLLEVRYEHIKYRWALSINKVNNIENVEVFNGFIKNLGYPELLIIEKIYNHTPSKVDLSIDYNLNIIRTLNNMANGLNKKIRIVMDFNYSLDNLDLIDSKKLVYTDFYFLSMLLKSKIYDVDIVSTNSLYSDHKDIKSDMLLYDSMGIRRNKYYITEYIRSLKEKLLFEDKGIFVSEENEEISIMLYDDYLEFYNRYKDYEIGLNEHNNNHYTFEISGLKGKYKIIEYNVSSRLDERGNSLEYSQYGNCISYDEREYLENNTTPKIKINFKEVHNKLTYKTIRGFGDVVLIKILPI